MAGQFSPNKTQQTKSRLRPQPEVGCKERRFSMSLQTISARFTDKTVKLDDAQERRVLTTLKMIYEGGSLDGKTANFPTRDLSSVVVGLHRGNWHSLRPIIARSGSIFATDERSFAAPGSLLNPTTAVGGRGCSRCFTFAS